MTWHDSAVLTSCNHYVSQLTNLPQEPWIQDLTHFYTDGHAHWNTHDLAPLAPPATFASAVNELTLGLGYNAKHSKGLIIGLEAAYLTPELAGPKDAAQAKISYLVEGCALSALWRRNADVGTIAAIAAGAASAPAAWPTGQPDWGGQQYQFFRNPSHHYRLGAGHTWRKLAQVLTGNDIDRLFGSYYVLDLSHLPKKKNKGKTVSAGRLAFLTRLVREYARDNPTGKLWFHGAGWPSPLALHTERPGLQVPARSATRILTNAFLGSGAPQLPARSGAVSGKKGRLHRYERYVYEGRSVVFSYHASGSTRVPRTYWDELSIMF